MIIPRRVCQNHRGRPGVHGCATDFGHDDGRGAHVALRPTAHCNAADCMNIMARAEPTQRGINGLGPGTFSEESEDKTRVPSTMAHRCFPVILA